MKRKRLIVIGVGRIGSGLLQRLSKDHELLCIDNSPRAGEAAKKLRGDGIVVMQADATSRLVLEEAGVNEAEAVIITTTTEQLNIEVARLLKEHFQPRRVIAVGTSSEGIKRLGELGAEVQDLFAASAAGIRNLLELRTRTATAIGLGKNEILEVELHPHSRLANKPLRNLAPLRWKIGILYREGNIIVPRGDTVLRPKDRLVILGDPAVLRTVAEIMTFSFQKFPLEYGSTAVAWLDGDEGASFFAEVEYLFASFPLRRIIFLRTARAAAQAERTRALISPERFPVVEERQSNLPVNQAIATLLREDQVECGMVILDSGHLRRLVNRIGKQLLLDLCTTAACPVLIARGTHPYERASVPGAEGIDPRHGLETALEAASALNNRVSALLVQPMRHIASDEDLRAFEAVRKSVSELSLIYRADVTGVNLQGNPVHAVLAALADQDLLFIDSSMLKRRQWPFPLSLLDPDPAWHLLKHARVSAFLVPAVEEAL